MDIEKIISEMTTAERIALVAGRRNMYTVAVPRLGVPQLSMADGPHGLRKERDANAATGNDSEPATAFPTAAATASGFNPDNAYKIGEAIARECIHYGVDVLLAPGINIKRNPRCGRNFEYFSEDPLVSAEMGKAFVRGAQSLGVGVSLKHFAANSNENYRYIGDSVIDERALREIYLRAFEKVVKETKPYTVMCAYNKLNGEFCSENKRLLTDILRGEWGFEGMVMSDWGAVKDRVKGIAAGLDLEMPGETAYCRRALADALKSGVLSDFALDAAVRNILRLVQKAEQRSRECDCDFDAHHDLAAEIACDCAVLLKNDGVLPLNSYEKICIIGAPFVNMRYQGAGSSLINPTRTVSPRDAFDTAGIDYVYAQGFYTNSHKPDRALEDAAIAAADGFDRVVVFAGLTDFDESEGGDRPNLKFPTNQAALIDRLIASGKRIIIVLTGGAPVELPFLSGAAAVLNMYLPGQAGGEAARRLLFGQNNPSGRLAETWPQSYSDVPYGDIYANSLAELYKESVFVGYRFYATAGVKPMFPFGFGLSYTTFEYSDFAVEKKDDEITAFCRVTNTGKHTGGEVVQLYSASRFDSAFRPALELRGFIKVYAAPGQTVEARITIHESDLAYYDVPRGKFLTENGTYELLLGASSEDIKFRYSLEITDGIPAFRHYPPEIADAYQKPEAVSDEVFARLTGGQTAEVRSRKFTTESRLTDLKRSLWGRMLFAYLLKTALKNVPKPSKFPPGAQRDNAAKHIESIKRGFSSSCLRSLSMMAGKAFPFNVAEGVADIANGKILRGIKKMRATIDASTIFDDK